MQSIHLWFNASAKDVRVPKRRVLKVVKVNYTPSAPWMVRVPEQLQKTEAAKKKFFRRESVAKAYVERLARQLGDYHAQALGLSDRQKLEASECYRLLESHNASLLEAVHHFLRYREHAKRSVPLGELFTEFLAIKEQDNVSRGYMADLRSKVGGFVAAYESRLTCDVTAADVEHWIRSLDIGSVSRESYRRNLSTFLERWRAENRPVVSGFHTSVEKECLRIFLRGPQPIVICAARGLDPFQLPADWQPKFERGEMLIVSPFDSSIRRPTKETAEIRNRLVAHLAADTTIIHATRGGLLHQLATARISGITDNPLLTKP